MTARPSKPEPSEQRPSGRQRRAREIAGLDVVVASYNTRETTLRCLGSVEAAAREAGEPVRTIVVDNASADGSADAIAAAFPGAVLVRSDENLGYARAINFGAAHGDAPAILILNSDVFPRPDAFARLLAFLHGNPSHVAASGVLVDVGTDRAQTGFAVRSYPTLGQQLALMTGLERHWPSNPVSRRARMADFDYGRTQTLDAQPAAACLLVRRNDFEAIGGFDEEFFFWFEDVDLLLRLRERGPVGFVHDAVFEHVGGASWRRWERPQVILSRYGSLFRFFAKHRPVGEQVAIRVAAGLLAALRAAAWLPLRPERSRAYAEVVRLALRR
jgi:GT2 family glycosyltransferase